MAKLALTPVLLAAACVVAGMYGAIHNQVSYTVSPDYFHAFKFDQFGIAPALRDRVGASIVGWLASWWMGIFIGVPLVLVGLVIPGWRCYLTRVMTSFVVVAATAFLAGFGALLFACCTISATSLPAFWFPDGVHDKVAFARAGTMHNFSYSGGAFGILTGSAYLGVARARLARRCNRPASQPVS